jgi:transcriptional regulator with XRE-family HTH domain
MFPVTSQLVRPVVTETEYLMPRRPPSPKAKGLGAALRQERNRAGLTLEEAARAIGLSKQVVSRLEQGQRNISPDEVAGLLGCYGVTGRTRDQLITMAKTLNDSGWWELHMPGMTQESSTLADYEDRATRIRSWTPLLIDGLLQTPDYARSFMLDDGIPPSEVESRWEARLRRQERLKREDVQYLGLIGEPALIGSDAIHREQLSALIEAAQRPNLTILVVPTQRLPRLGRVEAFLILDVPPKETVVHAELARSGAFLDEEPFTAPYLRRMSRLTEVALSATESSRRIVDIRDGMEP